ncbi:hypothetical protein [Mucilaginibacter sp. PAMB04168]
MLIHSNPSTKYTMPFYNKMLDQINDRYGRARWFIDAYERYKELQLHN